MTKHSHPATQSQSGQLWYQRSSASSCITGLRVPSPDSPMSEGGEMKEHETPFSGEALVDGSKAKIATQVNARLGPRDASLYLEQNSQILRLLTMLSNG